MPPGEKRKAARRRRRRRLRDKEVVVGRRRIEGEASAGESIGEFGEERRKMGF